MKMYNVDQAFELLKQYKITSNKESVRRWLRAGTIKGIEPTSRKEGWKIREDDLLVFIQERTPDEVLLHAINVVNEDKQEMNEQSIRAEMWWELVHKNIFEDVLEVKKKQVQACIEHNGHSKDFGEYVWEIISKHKRGYKTPRIPYLLDAFLFDSERILMDSNYADVEEKILFALIGHLRKKKVGN